MPASNTGATPGRTRISTAIPCRSRRSQSGGVARDQIPPIDDPVFVSVAEAEKLIGPTEPVIALEVGGERRAYPLAVLIWHEIVNDTVAGRPVAVTYCPLCDAALVFDRRVAGRVLDFGTTGLLRFSDLVMWDRQTESWWQQFLGEAMVGALTGERLEMLPSRVESFERFAAGGPGGKVLMPNDPALRSYGSNPYAGYDGAHWPFLYRGAYKLAAVPPLARVAMVGKQRLDRGPAEAGRSGSRRATWCWNGRPARTRRSTRR